MTYIILVNTKPCCFTCERNVFGAALRAFAVPYAYSGVWRKSYFSHNGLVSLLQNALLKRRLFSFCVLVSFSIKIL